MTKTRPVAAVLVAALVLVGAAAPAAAGALAGSDSTPAATGTVQYASAQENNTTQNDSVDVAVGQQLSTVVSVTGDEVETEVENTAFELSFEGATESERAEAVAERVAELRERASEIREDYRKATREYEAGDLTKSEYAQRLATLNARADSVLNSLATVRDRATNLSALELRAAGVTSSGLSNVSENLSAVAGAGPNALLQRFLGTSQGEIELETRGGLSIEAESEDGERSRELQRPQDDDDALTVNQSAALDTARAALSTPQNGSWTLQAASVHDEDGSYKFEFALTGANSTGEAEVRVDGSSGEVFRLEEEVEAPERDDEDGEDGEGDEREGEREGEGEDDELALVVASGTPAANETITVRVLSNGDPAGNVTVTLNGEVVGTTAADGTVTVTLPASGEAKLQAARGDSEGELEFEFGDEDEAVYRALAVDATVSDNATTVSVSYDGEAVEGASVYANGDRVGQTGSDGTVSFATPSGDEVELEVVKGEFEAELSFALQDGEYVQTEGAHEGDGDKAEAEREDEDRDEEREGDEEAEDSDQQTEDSDEETEDDGDETETTESADDDDETETTETTESDDDEDEETDTTETTEDDD